MKDESICGCRDLDERLAPYVDGEASSITSRAVDAHLAACPPCRERASRERLAREILHANREGLKVRAPDMLRERCAVHRPNTAAAIAKPGIRRWVPLSVAATLLLAVGGVFLFSGGDHAKALAAGLAMDHVKCFQIQTDTNTPANASALGAEWAQKQGWPLTMPGTAADEHLKLLCVRSCLSMDGRVAHVMYMWRGEPLSIYVLPRAVSEDRVVEALGHEARIWSANGRTYAVLARGRPDGFDDVVRYVQTRVR